MHELAITQGMLDVVLDAAHQAEARRVESIHLVVGELSSIVDDSVQFYFDFLSRDTLAAGAVLHFRRAAATATCQQCGHQFEVRPPLVGQCPVCHSTRLHVRGGQEMYVESIEVEEEEPDATDTRRQADPQRE